MTCNISAVHKPWATQLCAVLPNIRQCSARLALSPVWRLHSVDVCTAMCLSDLQVTQQGRTHVHRCS